MRENKKEATARALAESAFELASERGMDGFVIGDVVERAGYARRTFANYFSCKEEAVAAVLLPKTDALALIANLPPDTPLLDALQELVRSQLDAEMFDKVRRLVSLCNDHPALEPHLLAAARHTRMAVPEVWSELTRGRYSDKSVHVLLAMVYGAISLLFEGSIDVLPPGAPSTDRAGVMGFEDFLNMIFGHLRNGFRPEAP